MRATDYADELTPFLAEYRYQPELTAKLDGLSVADINQETINEIVLWKVNRYVRPNDVQLRELNELRLLRPGEHRGGVAVLRSLIRTHGVDLPMASAILRFRNPQVFQIIDRHAYRAIYDEPYPLYAGTDIEIKIETYVKYLDNLMELCYARHLAFESIDRLLYVFDGKVNGTL